MVFMRVGENEACELFALAGEERHIRQYNIYAGVTVLPELYAEVHQQPFAVMAMPLPVGIGVHANFACAPKRQEHQIPARGLLDHEPTPAGSKTSPACISATEPSASLRSSAPVSARPAKVPLWPLTEMGVPRGMARSIHSPRICAKPRPESHSEMRDRSDDCTTARTASAVRP